MFLEHLLCARHSSRPGDRYCIGTTSVLLRGLHSSVGNKQKSHVRGRVTGIVHIVSVQGERSCGLQSGISLGPRGPWDQEAEKIW